MTEIVQVSELPSFTEARQNDLFTVHDWLAQDDREAFLSAHADRIRGMTTMGMAGADRDLIARFPKLEIISCFAVGVDAVDLDYCQANGIAVTNTPDVLTDCVADMAFALAIGGLRRVVEGDRYIRAGRWQSEGLLALGGALKGRTLGIVGMGRIGEALAHRARAFGMRIAYHNRSPKPVEAEYHADPVALAAASDVLALTCPGGPETRHLVNRAVLEALGPAGYLVNVSRGSVVDEPALVRALQAGTIAGAGLDVFEDEPDVPEALFALDNVTLSPHQGSGTVETRTAMGDLMIDNLLAWFERGETLTRVV